MRHNAIMIQFRVRTSDSTTFEHSLPVLLKDPGEISYCLVKYIHHTSVCPSNVVLDELVFVYVLLRRLNWRVDILECHIQEHRLRAIV